MIIIDSGSELSPKDIEAQPPSQPYPGPSASTSSSPNQPHPYPQADDSNESQRLLGRTTTGNHPEPIFPGPPPAFTPYEAEWFEVGYGDVVSHDEHLNTDGEALYRFLLTQASQRPPSYRIHCKGSHTETRYRWVTSHDSGHYAHQHHHHHSNNTSTRTESYTERVTDFDFCIDVTPPFPSLTTAPSLRTPLSDAKTRTGQSAGEQDENFRDDFSPIHWSVADNEPVHRGKMVREIQVGASSTRGVSPDGDLPLLSSSFPATTSTRLRTATRRECQDYSQWIDQLMQKGLPPWVSGVNSWNITNPTSRDVLKSSKSVRQWADEYCASPKLLKEFVYTKILYGWDISQLESAIRSTITLAPYHGDVQVTFTPINSKIYIRPSNRLSRALSNAWLKFLSIILFVFPFIWLFKRFHSKGGGKWEVCGSAYALKRLIPVDNPNSNSVGTGDSVSGNELPSYEDVAGASTLASTSSILQSPTLTSITSSSFPIPSPSLSASTSTRILQTPQGPHKLIGQREGEWFRHWEPIILRSVLTKYQCTTPLTLHTEPYGRYAAPGSALEGYHDTPSSATAPVVSIPVVVDRLVGRNGPGEIYLP